MSQRTRLVAVVLTAVMVLAVSTPAVVASSKPAISVDQGDTTYTVTVNHNGTPVNDSTVNVTATDPNSSYAAGPALTDENGTVTFDLPEHETEVTITAAFENHSETEAVVLAGANDSETDGPSAGEPFGQLLTSWLDNLVDPGDNTIMGQAVSEWVTANNPGSEHRSDKANPGGNGGGPPEHATNQSENGNNASADGNHSENGPPGHANNASEKGNQTANEDTGGDGNGPPDHAGEDEDDGEDEESESDTEDG